MVRRTKRISVYKPKKHGRKWRIEIRDGVTRCRERPSFDREEEAWEAYWNAVREAERFQQPTIEGLIARYKEYLVEKGNRVSSIRTTLYRIERFFPNQSLLPCDLTPKQIQALYDLKKESMSVDSHRNMLAEVRSFLRWCVKKGHLDNNPAEGVEGIGKRSKGKPQLRPSEAEEFLDKALELSQAGSDGALAVAMALLLGLRAQEITRRVVRDVDPKDRLLFIDDSKTKAGERKLEIPDVLWPHFQHRIDGRGPNEPLFPAKSQDGFHHPEWVNDNTKKLCKALDLPLVCAHGLRGSHSSIAQEAGTTGHVVAKQLGHADEKTTKEHYTEPGLGERKNRERVFKVLSGGRKD